MARPCVLCACSTVHSSHSTLTCHMEMLLSATAQRRRQQRLRNHCTCNYLAFIHLLFVIAPWALCDSLTLSFRCVLGNTTILADFACDEEINRFFAQGQSMCVSAGWQVLASSQSRLSSDAFSSGSGGGELHSSSSLWGAPSYSSSLWGSSACPEGGNRLSSPSPIASFLPVDHMTGSGDSM